MCLFLHGPPNLNIDTPDIYTLSTEDVQRRRADRRKRIQSQGERRAHPQSGMMVGGHRNPAWDAERRARETVEHRRRREVIAGVEKSVDESTDDKNTSKWQQSECFRVFRRRVTESITVFFLVGIYVISGNMREDTIAVKKIVTALRLDVCVSVCEIERVFAAAVLWQVCVHRH